MKVTGYQLMDRIEALRQQAQTISGQFADSLYRFADPTEEKADPRDLMRDYMACERQVALLQAAQAAYNVRVTVDVAGEVMSLQQAVKLIGSANRVKTNWLSTVKPPSEQRGVVSHYYITTGNVRDKDSEYAVRVVSIPECLRLSQEATDFATALKQAIRAGNAVELDLDIDPGLFR
jgi:hypothetical protein